MDFAGLVGYRFADFTWSFTAERAEALQRAIGNQAQDGLPPTLAFSADMDQRVVDRLFALTGLAAHQLLHGEQHFRYHRPLQPGQPYRSSARLSEVTAKARFSLLSKQTRLFAADGGLACEMLSVYVVMPRPAAPSDGPRLAAGGGWRLAQAMPAISREQIAAFARASGDDNRVHLDSAVARRAGHADVFAQGMLGMGALGSLLDASRLRRFGVRFVRPMALGDRPMLYQAGGADCRLALTNHQGDIRIHGYAESD